MIRQSIPFSGIDTSAPDQTVPDGACADILNMRVRNGALHHVCAPEVVHPIAETNGWTIVHKMECLAANEYVAIKQVDWNSVRVSVVAVAGGSVNEVTPKHISVVPGSVSDYSVWSFGTVLYLNKGTGETLEERTFVYKNGTFAEFDLGKVDAPQFELQLSGKQVGIQGIYQDTEVLTVQNGKKEFFYNERIGELNADGYVVGLFAVIVAYVMHDGTVVKPSAPKYVSSYYSGSGSVDVGTSFCLRCTTEGTAPNAIFHYKDDIRGVKTTVQLKQQIPVVGGLIKSARVFVTRVIPLWNYEKLHEEFVVDYVRTDRFPGSYMYRSRIVNKEALDLNQPFYELCDISSGSLISEPITSSNLNENIVHETPYQASFSNHTSCSMGKFEYNNRLHLYGVTTKFTSGSLLNAKSPENYQPGSDGRPSGGGSDPFPGMTAAYLILVVKMTVDNKTIYVQCMSNVWANSTNAVIPVLLAYPDVRAERFEIAVVNTQGQQLYYKAVSPKISYANNLAYFFVEGDGLYNNVHTEALLSVSLDTSIVWDLKDTTAVAYESNKLLVSGQNNPFVFAPENAYLIGEQGSSIDSLQTATEQISETRFGAFPLYAFTDRAVYALEVGQGEVLYSAVVGIGNDRKLPGTTTVGAANLVFFVSDQGVMALEGRYAVCISHPLDTLPPATPFDVPFEQYAAGALLDYNPTENELRVYNPAHDYAFVYSLDSKLWTRRTWSGRHVSPWELITDAGIASSSKEQAAKPLSEVRIVTRPLKLGSTEYKRIETVMARLEAGGATTYKITLEGSNDLRAWNSLITVTNSRMLRRSMSSYLYHRVRIEASVFDWLQATHLDAEFYNRFVRRLR